MSSADYILLSATGPGTERIAFLFGLYGRTGDHNGRPAYKQLQTREGHDLVRPCLYNYSGNWAVGPSLGASQCYLVNVSKSIVVPTSGWKIEIGGYLGSAPGFSVTHITDLSSVLCSTITITARGEAAKERPECLGTFTPVPNFFCGGRQMFSKGKGNNNGQLLGVIPGGPGSGYWGVFKDECVAAEKIVNNLRSGSNITGLCPAARNHEQSSENWNFRDGEGMLQESSDIIVTCAKHSAGNAASAPAVEHLPNIDDVMKYIEGEPSSKPATKSKKKKKSKAKVSKTTASLSDSR